MYRAGLGADGDAASRVSTELLEAFLRCETCVWQELFVF